MDNKLGINCGEFQRMSEYGYMTQCRIFILCNTSSFLLVKRKMAMSMMQCRPICCLKIESVILPVITAIKLILLVSVARCDVTIPIFDSLQCGCLAA